MRSARMPEYRDLPCKWHWSEDEALSQIYCLLGGTLMSQNARAILLRCSFIVGTQISALKIVTGFYEGYER